MKAILISIHSQWVELILKFIKKDEIRKGTAIGKAINKLIEEQGVAPMLIYCTKGKNLLRKVVEYDESSMNWYQPRYEIINDKNCDFDILNGKVIARFNATAEEITTRQDRFKEFTFYETSLDMENLLKQSCLDYNELDNYLQGEKGTDIHINDIEIFDKPKEISEFQGTCNKSCAGYKVCKIKPNCNRPLTRAPQSWCYIEV